MGIDGLPASTKSDAGRWPGRSEWRRSSSIPTTCRRDSTISEVLPASKREALCEIIFAKALSVSIVFASVEEIDNFNIRGAALRAMARAVAALS